jgi:tetratricopeptide (TPR) repeat protein
MSKPMVVTLPIVMILLDYWPLGRLQSRRIVTNITEVMPIFTNKGKKKNKFKKEALEKNISPPNNRKLSESKIAGIIPLWQLCEKTPFFILSAVLVIITLYHSNTPSENHILFPLYSRIANAPVAFMTYLEKTFWPHDMAILYPFTEHLPLWQVTVSSLLILVITTFVIVMAKHLPYLFAGWMWFAITTTPVIGIIQISKTTPYTMADRYHYLPSIGLAVMLAWGIPALIKSEEIKKRLLFPAGMIFLAAISFLSWNQCGYWKDNITLFSHALKVTDYNWLAYNNRGVAYNDLGNYRQAIEDYDRSIEINPGFAMAYYNRGIAFKRLGDFKQAIKDYDRAIEIRPGYATAYNNRGSAYNGLGNYRQAIEDLNRAIEIKPGYAEAYNNRAKAYNGVGNYRQAIEDLNMAIEIKPGYADAYYNRAIVYLKQGDNILGCRDAKKACELGDCKVLEMAKDHGLCR